MLPKSESGINEEIIHMLSIDGRFRYQHGVFILKANTATDVLVTYVICW